MGQCGGWLLASVLLFAVTAAGASAEVPVIVEGAAAVAFLNAQRQANGIPPFRTIENDLVEWCPAEDGGVGGAGDRDLSNLPYWDDFFSPWEPAPFHEALMYNPTYTSVGEINKVGPWDGTGPVTNQACISMGGELVPSAPEGFVFYAPGGPDDVPPVYTASEIPATPEERLHLPVTTGPNLIVYAIALGVGLPSYNAAINVDLETASGNEVPDVHFVTGPDCVILVPPPLVANEHYVGKVTVEFRASESLPVAQTVEEKLNFYTTERPNPAAISRISTEPSGSGGWTLAVAVSGNRDPNATLAVTQGVEDSMYPVAQNEGEQLVRVPVPREEAGVVCLRRYGSDGYQALQACRSFPEDEARGKGTITTSGGSSSGAPRLTLIGPLRVRGEELQGDVQCAGAAGRMCAGEITMHTSERLERSGRVLALAAIGTGKRTVTTGAQALRVPAGRNARLKVRLNRVGLRLLREFKRVPVEVTVVQSASHRSHQVARRFLKFSLIGASRDTANAHKRA